MTIKELAKATGLPVSTIRYYERRGLLPEPERFPNNYRNYPDQSVKTLHLILYFSGLGLTLGQIRTILRKMTEKTLTKTLILELINDQKSHIENQLKQLIFLKRRLNALESHEQLVDEFVSFDWFEHNSSQKPVNSWIEQVNSGQLHPDIASLLIEND
ncbi:MerR family transcriptional regulator [Streptococcus sp. S784/96/1]|uniref:MerR family transcriptional regulator n=2 Tax=Streptococcus sp. S784/96/1 TaxID=2653499 RepID=UPI0013869949|nr:MerR family transcriptional regulator [Streptococcus sp. S784/96/1]